MRRNKIFEISLILLLAAAAASAQSSAVTGIVMDPSQQILFNASISVKNVNTGVVRETQTNAQGFYTVPLLPEGDYSVQAQAPGFQALERTGLHLDAGQTLRLDMMLKIATPSQSVQVTSGATGLDMEKSAQSTVVGEQPIVDLPLNGRNTLALATLVPGVRTISSFGSLSTSAYSDGRITLSGGTPSGNNVIIDGAAAENYTSGGPQVVLSPDATEEFQIITHNADAQYGRMDGGVMMFVSKSGGNDFHGDLWEFLRNKVLDANDFFSNETGAAQAPFTFNQFGATIGGPIRRNKTFFFVNWESARQREGERSFFTVPTDLQRQGNFSQTFDTNDHLLTIYDPLTTVANPNEAGHYIRTPFPGNIVPANRLSPVAQAIGAYYPEPNEAGNEFTGANNFQGYGSGQENKDLWGAKIDQYFTPVMRLSARYTWDSTRLINPAYFGGNIADPDGAPAAYPRNSAVTNFTDVLRPNLLFEIHAGLNRFGIARTPRSEGFDITKIGMPASINQEQEFQEFPYISMSDVSPIGQDQGGRVRAERQFLDYRRHRHLAARRARHPLRRRGADLPVEQRARPRSVLLHLQPQLYQRSRSQRRSHRRLRLRVFPTRLPGQRRNLSLSVPDVSDAQLRILHSG